MRVKSHICFGPAPSEIVETQILRAGRPSNPWQPIKPWENRSHNHFLNMFKIILDNPTKTGLSCKS